MRCRLTYTHTHTHAQCHYVSWLNGAHLYTSCSPNYSACNYKTLQYLYSHYTHSIHQIRGLVDVGWVRLADFFLFLFAGGNAASCSYYSGLFSPHTHTHTSSHHSSSPPSNSFYWTISDHKRNINEYLNWLIRKLLNEPFVFAAFQWLSWRGLIELSHYGPFSVIICLLFGFHVIERENNERETERNNSLFRVRTLIKIAFFCPWFQL